jgi:thiol-disulfide isomerase/thioredoxin
MSAATLVVLVVGALAAGGCGGGGDDDKEQLQDLAFPAFLDGDTAGEPVTAHFSDYFAENLSGTRIVMVNASAGWCVPCMREAEAMGAFAATYEPQGVAILTVIFQDQNADPADAEFVKAWVDNFELTIPALIDADFQTSIYFDATALPSTMFVDAETHEILETTTGAATGDDPMQDYRELLDYYLEQ